MSQKMRELGKLIGEHRRDQGISQADAARKSGLNRNTIRNIETGAHAGLYDNVEKLARAVGYKLTGPR